MATIVTKERSQLTLKESLSGTERIPVSGYEYVTPNQIAALAGGGSGGTNNYNELSNKPQIEGNTLQGNVTLETLGIASQTELNQVRAIAESGIQESANSFYMRPRLTVRRNMGSKTYVITVSHPFLTGLEGYEAVLMVYNRRSGKKPTNSHSTRFYDVKKGWCLAVGDQGTFSSDPLVAVRINGEYAYNVTGVTMYVAKRYCMIANRTKADIISNLSPSVWNATDIYSKGFAGGDAYPMTVGDDRFKKVKKFGIAVRRATSDGYEYSQVSPILLHITPELMGVGLL